MWQNLQWLRAEWRYYREWPKLYMAKKLEGVADYELPKRNNPWGYTFAWAGVVVVLPSVLLAVAVVLILAMLESAVVTRTVVIVASVLALVGIIFWIIGALIRLNEKGASEVVESHWKKTYGKNA